MKVTHEMQELARQWRLASRLAAEHESNARYAESELRSLVRRELGDMMIEAVPTLTLVELLMADRASEPASEPASETLPDYEVAKMRCEQGDHWMCGPNKGEHISPRVNAEEADPTLPDPVAD